MSSEVSPLSLEDITIRHIKPEDEAELANVVRSTLKEFGADKPGTVYFDDTTDHLFHVFRQKRSVYFIADNKRKIVGGGGVFPSPGLPDDTCELVKMYLLKEARGIGLGKLLIEKCIAFARESGYKNIYIETMPELKQALKVYEKFDFQYINKPMGNTGHFGCDVWMIKYL
ncbi:MAG: GNAT family N-acetyltransferase [Flavisolibacter sp.]|jgi:putative acetyltransferase|nr:GNAT family N-acetyltransferase [Flavisolibacter sp.]